MEPLVIDWAKEEARMARIVRKFMFISNNSILNRLYNIFFNQINIAEGALPNDEF